MVEWYYKLSGHKFEQTLRDSEKPGVLQSMGLQRVGRDLVTEQQQPQWFMNLDALQIAAKPPNFKLL